MSVHLVYKCTPWMTPRTLDIKFIVYTIVLNAVFQFSAPDRSRLRLSAANGILRLARNPVLVDIISVQQFQRLALVAQVRDFYAVNCIYKCIFK